MKQIISVQLGQCGNRISQSFWEQIAEQHHINQKGVKQPQQIERLQNIDPFFTENSKGYYSSKAILIDMDPGAVDSILAQKYGQIHRYENVITGRASTSNNWAKGYQGQGSQYVQYAMDSIRRQAELCQNLQAFQIVHSIGGGTGSGMGCLLIDRLSDQYARKMKLSYTVFPSKKASENTLQIYNTILSIPSLLLDVDQCFTIDNESLFNKYDSSKIVPTYGNLNKIVGDVISGVTCGMRFPGQLNYSPRKLCYNMVPSPKMHFFIVGSSSMTLNNSPRNKNNKVAEILQNIMYQNTFLSKIDPRHGRYITNAFIFRGNASTYEIQTQILDFMNRHSSYFVQWICNNINWTLCRTPSKASQLSSTIIGNTSAIGQKFKDILQNYNKMFEKRAFIHWYTNEGLQLQKFKQGQQKLKDLIFTYQINYYGDSIQEYGDDIGQT